MPHTRFITRFMTRWARFGAWFFVAMLVALALAVWFSGSSAALRLGVQAAQSWSNSSLLLGDVQGSLYGPLRIGSLRYSSDSTRVEITGLSLDWSPWALLRRELQVDTLVMQEVLITPLKPSTAPMAMPTSLALPVELFIAKAHIARLVLDNLGTQNVLSDTRFALNTRGANYEFSLANMQSPWGSAQGQVELGQASPFALSGNAVFKQDGEDFPYQAKAQVSGSLAQTVLQVVGSAGAAQVQVDASIAPFAQQPFTALRMQASHVDPAQWVPGLGRADINFLVTLRGQGEKGFLGELSAHNAMAGTWDRSRLPVQTLSASVAGSADAVELSNIVLDLAQAGGFVGDAHLDRQGLSLALHTSGFDPSGIYSSMRPMKLGGQIRLDSSNKAQSMLADLRNQTYQFHLDASHQDQVIAIREASVLAKAGRLKFTGQLDLDTKRTFRLKGDLEEFDPAALGDFPTAQINARFDADGQLAPEPLAALRFTVARSLLRGQRLGGEGKVHVSAKRVWGLNVSAQLGRNQLQAQGNLGMPDDKLTLVLDAQDLAQIAPGLCGKLRANATLQGSMDSPAGLFDMTAQGVCWHDSYSAAAVRAKGQLGPGADGTLSLSATASTLRTPQFALQKSSLVAQGSLSQHTLELALKNPHIDLTAGASGGWHAKSGWAGQLLSLRNQGPLALHLVAPATLELAPQRYVLRQAQLDALGGHITVQNATYTDGQIQSSGSVKGVGLAAVQALLPQQLGLQTDLVLSGNWNVDLGATANAHLAVWRDRGDIRLQNPASTALGLTELTWSADVADQRLSTQLQASGTTLGRLKAHAQTQLSRRAAAWGIAGEAPLEVAADLSVQSLAWLGPIISPSGALAVDGALKAQVRGTGTFAHPRWVATAQADKLMLEIVELGTRLTQGSFTATLQDDVVLLNDLVWRSGDGQLSAQGRLAYGQGAPEAQLRFTAKQLQVLSQPDRYLVLSGTGEAALKDSAVQLSGTLRADRGLIELPSADTPRVSNDVVVSGRNDQEGVPAQHARNALGFDMALDLGDSFYLKGKGLDAQLGGAVRLKGLNGALPSASGTIQVIKGAYAAYGQRLVIDRGILNFQGPVDNPGLNIVATRKNLEVQAGVAITGSAQSPRVKLVSTPSVPDSEKLSWLVLGRGMDTANGQDFSALQLAAGTLLSAGESVTLQQRIARSAGLEEISLKGSGSLESTVLTLGKRLSSRAYLSYERGLAGAESLAKIDYSLTPRWSVRGQAGTTPAVDLFYTLSFD